MNTPADNQRLANLRREQFWTRAIALTFALLAAAVGLAYVAL